ncbi:MAG: hypothetical protein OXG53_13525 [Chloroflexi bacterium]|nr:hypothetical protein [Chloroflexota bacterium]
MDSGGAIRQLLANGLRIVHMVLWLTIPTSFLLWLALAEVPAECVPEYGWYQGNVLCVSEDTYFLIVLGIFLPSTLAIDLWISGYMFQAVGRFARGDGKLPPVRLSAIAAGVGLAWSSLRYWLPFFAMILAVKFMSNLLPYRAALQAFDSVMLAALPLMVVLLWGNLVGAARYAVHRDRSLMYRRRENIRMALVNIKATLALTLLVILVTALAVGLWEPLEDLSILTIYSDPIIEAALSAFAFFLFLISWSIACSYLIARYARAIGIGDHRKDGVRSV